MKFFVYVGIDYYPYAETVEAESATDAIDAAMSAESRNVHRGRFGCIAVPLDQVTMTGDSRYWEPDLLQDEVDMKASSK